MTEENTVPSSSDSLMTPAKAASFIGVSGRTLTRWRIEGKIEAAGITEGGHFRYSVRECRRMRERGLKRDLNGGSRGHFRGVRPGEEKVDADHPMFS